MVGEDKATKRMTGWFDAGMRLRKGILNKPLRYVVISSTMGLFVCTKATRLESSSRALEKLRGC